MIKNAYIIVLVGLSMGVSSNVIGFEYLSCPGNASSTCPAVTGNKYQNCGNCCYDSSADVMYCSCTMSGYENPIQCQNSQLDIYKCDNSQPIQITSEGYLQCTYTSEYGGGLYTGSEAHEYGRQTCTSMPEMCGGPSLQEPNLKNKITQKK